MSITRFEDIRSLNISTKDYLVFGGTFDPFHEEHLHIVKQLSPYFRKIFIAPTAQNVFKKQKPSTYKQRLEMIELILEYEDLSHGTNEQIEILDFEYLYAKEVVDLLRSKNTNQLFWAVGEDILDSIHYWKDWNTLSVPMISMPVLVNLHATDVRKNHKLLHPAIIDYVKQQCLYVED